MRIQLVGGITNVSNYVNLFARAEVEAYMIDGIKEVVNPCNLPHEHDKTWESYMVECLNSLDTVDAIFYFEGGRHRMVQDWSTNMLLNIKKPFISKFDFYLP